MDPPFFVGKICLEIIIGKTVIKSRTMDLASRIEHLIEPALNHIGYTVVEILVMGSSRLKLDISIEKVGGDPVNITDCVKANREIAAILDVEDPISSAYTLDVSSPGIDRPLVKLKDFKRFVGERVKVNTYEFVEERKKISGVLTAVSDTEITVTLHENDVTPDGHTELHVAYDDIRRAKLDPQF